MVLLVHALLTAVINRISGIQYLRKVVPLLQRLTSQIRACLIIQFAASLFSLQPSLLNAEALMAANMVDPGLMSLSMISEKSVTEGGK